MPLKKILFKPGVNRENTRYTNEGGWYVSNLVRFRQGTPEKVGGWQRISGATFLGVCRSLWNWVTLGALNLIGVGTNLKFYIEKGGAYYDITPIRTTVTLGTDPFTANGTTTVTVTANSHGCVTGDFVTFSQASGTYASILNAEFQVTVINANSYTITTASALAAGSYGGSAVVAAYQLNVGPALSVPLVGWGGGTWGGGTWGTGSTTYSEMRLWNQMNYGEDLVFGPRDGGLYYWDATGGTASRGELLSSLGGAVTITLGNPAVVTATKLFTEGTGLQFGGNLPTGITANTTYYVFNVDGLSFNLLDAAGNIVSTSPASPLIGTVARGGVGNMTASVSSNSVALSGVTAIGALGGTNVVNLTLSGVAASGFTGTTNEKAITGTSASANAGAVSVGNVSVQITGNTSYASVGSVTLSGLVNAYISRIVDVPVVQRLIFVSDTSRFVFAFGCNELGSVVQDPMLIRWSNQEDLMNWTPNATNQAGGIRLSHGSTIVAAVQTRQEIVVFTDSSVYSLQYQGAPVVWGVQLLGDNISIYSQNAAVIASGKVYWMGVDKFYVYDGRVQTLRCDLRNHIFSDINQSQNLQIFAGTNEGFNEVWWYYCSANSTTIDKYVIYNYAEDIWYYGSLGRTAWLDSGLRDYPVAATYSYNLVNHEQGVDDNETATPLPINAVISSSEFDIDDGHNFGFIWRILPDITFRNSTGSNTPQVTMTLAPMQNSGSGVNNPPSTGGVDNATVSRVAVATIEEFTGQVYIRVRGRQLIFTCESNQLGTQWQLGAPRIDIKPDGRRGNT